MKLVTAIVRPIMLADVRSALQDIGVTGLTVSDVQGFGRQRGHHQVYRGAEVDVDFVPSVKLETVVSDYQAQAVVEAIVSSAYTGQIGDGKVWVTPVESMTRIRTGEGGAAAL